ncbi:MAG: hypothetical protein U0325_04505 [Polyangiales bacterium]
MSAQGAELQPSVVVDFPRGRVESRGGTAERLVLLPATAFASLFEGPTDLRPLADDLADAVARDARAHLDGNADPTPDEVATSLSHATAARGMGLVAFERWGDLLCVVWRDPPASSAGFASFAERFLARAVGAVAGMSASGAVIDRDAARITVLLGAEATCAHVRTLVAQGVGLPRLADHLLAGEPS